jgi:hypothetical protein
VGAFLQALQTWWNNPGKLIPWLEANQGLVSALSTVIAIGAIIAAWKMALEQQRAALDAEARSNARARAAKEQGIAEAVRAETERKLQDLGSFATAARGVIMDVENHLIDDANEMRPMLVGAELFMPLSVEVRTAVRASADTLAALVASMPQSPGMVRVIRDAIAQMLEIELPKELSSQDYDAVLEGWRLALMALRQRVSDEELVIITMLDPRPPQAPPISHHHF